MKMRLFDEPGEWEAFERVLAETLELRPMRICAYCVIPNRWHMVLWPRRDGELAAFMQRLTITHVRRWQEHRYEVGTAHFYRGRDRPFPVQNGPHFLKVCRCVERNASRAGLIGGLGRARITAAAALTLHGEAGAPITSRS